MRGPPQPRTYPTIWPVAGSCVVLPMIIISEGHPIRYYRDTRRKLWVRLSRYRVPPFFENFDIATKRSRGSPSSASRCHSGSRGSSACEAPSPYVAAGRSDPCPAFFCADAPSMGSP